MMSRVRPSCITNAIALLGFLVWGHHMFTSGQSTLANVAFSLITFSVAIPSAIKVFNWVTTMYKGSIHLETPMLYAMGFIWMFSIGGLTGLFLAALSVDIHFQDTYFVVAHFHYVMVGSMLFAFIGGMNYWFPKMFGKMYNERVAMFAAILLFIGFNLTFFIQFVAGSHGAPRRYAEVPVQFVSHHFWSTIGAYTMGTSRWTPNTARKASAISPSVHSDFTAARIRGIRFSDPAAACCSASIAAFARAASRRDRNAFRRATCSVSSLGSTRSSEGFASSATW